MKFHFILLFCLSSIIVSAQNNALQAKAAYMLAEEEFNNGKYADAIKYLDEASAKLGTANAKILYLKIMSYKALSEKDDKQIFKLKEAIAAFEKAPDVSDFNEEKVLEVLKLKMQVAKYKPVSETEDKVHKMMFTGSWAYYYGKLKLGMPVSKLEEMFQQVPDWLRIIQAEAAKESGLVDLYAFKIGLKNNEISSLSAGIASLNYKNSKDSSTTPGYALLNQFVADFGGVPQVNEVVTPYKKKHSYLSDWGGVKTYDTDNITTIRTYTWEKDGVKVILRHHMEQMINYRKREPVFSSAATATITVSN